MSSGHPQELAPDDAAFDISNDAEVRALLRAEEDHFWHRSRNQYILQKLRDADISPSARILELGCGAGCVAAALSHAGYQVTGVDGHRALIDVAKTRAPKARFLCRDLRGGVPELGAATFDVVALFDVLEHLDDPRAALRGALGFLRGGGYLVGTVPALMALWSPVDERAGHKTRYSSSTLSALLARVDRATVLEVSPFFRSLVPLLWMQRRFVGRRGTMGVSQANLSIPRWPLNAALHALVTVEHAFARRTRTAIPGASLWFALAKT